MPKAKKKQTVTKTKKSVKAKTTKARKVTAKKATMTKSKKKTTTTRKATTKRKPPTAKVTTKPKPKRRKLKKYSPRSRYATFRVGDRLMFERIMNWDGDGEIERIVGVVVRRIDDKALGLKFIEVQFDLREQLAFMEDSIRIRRFVVK